jgi:hypothetical protein
MWSDTFDSIFFLAAGGIVAGLFHYGIKYCYKTKIDECNICGIVKIHRDTRRESIFDLEKGNEITDSKDAIPPASNNFTLTPTANRGNRSFSNEI